LTPLMLARAKDDPAWRELLEDFSTPEVDPLPVTSVPGTGPVAPAGKAVGAPASLMEAGRHRLDLHLAVAQKDYRALENLLADGADVTTYDSRGRTALM